MSKPNGKLILTLMGADGAPLTGKADIFLEHQVLSDQRAIRGFDASKQIVIKGLHRAPQGFYLLRVDPEQFNSVGQFINIRPSGDTVIELSFGESKPASRKPLLSVFVADYKSEVVTGAKVTVRTDRPERVKMALDFDPSSQEYRTDELSPGGYLLEVRASGLASEKREIELQPAGSKETVILGKKDMPFYHRGRVKVPFEPRRELIAATLHPSFVGDVEAEVELICRELQLEQEEVPEAAQADNVRLFRLAAGSGEQEKKAILRQLLERPSVIRAGAVIAAGEHAISYLTDELVIRFKAHVSEDTVQAMARDLNLEILRAVPYSPNTFHLRSPEPGTYDLLDVEANLAGLDDVEWAEPNMVTTAELDTVNPPDFLWSGVWDRQLVSTPDAWQQLQDSGLETFGEPSVIIAAVDQGIESAGGVPLHPDFQGTVSDGSSKVYQLYDFRTLVANNDSPPGSHGMGVSGVAAAKADNVSVVPGQDEGLAGAAPNCRIMGLIYPYTEAEQADMYIWAAGFDPDSPLLGFPAPISPGADIFTTSIGFGGGAPISGLASSMLDYLTSYGRDGKGCACFFSAGNANNNFTTYRPWAAYAKTWGMAASTLANNGVTEIRAPYSGYGPVELCAPSHDQYPILHNPPARYGTWSCQLLGDGNLIGHAATQTALTAGVTAGATVLDVVSSAGFAIGDQILIETPGAAGSEPASVTGVPAVNQLQISAVLNNHAIGDAVMTGAANYRNNFGGTSSATPLAAGVAALVLSANPDLTWIELRQILRETAEKIDAGNTDPIGQWLDAFGVPSVSSGLPAVYSQWYGYGRIDASQAIDAALSFPFTRDLVVRENLADTGTVPSGGGFWNSPDIWVRNTDPLSEGAAALPANYNTAGPHQAPIAGVDNWVYARVANIGTDASLDYYVRIYITHFPGFEFTYPASFIPSNGPGDPVPSPMTPGTYLIGEVSASNLAPGTDTIVNVQWPSALIPPETVVVGLTTVTWHPCLLVEVSPHDGPAPTGSHVWDDNNLAQKNVPITYPDTDGDFAIGAVVGHVDNPSRFLMLEIDRGRLPRQVRLYVDLVSPQLKDRLRRFAAGEELPEFTGCSLTFLEETRLQLHCPETGDSVLTVAPQSKLARVFSSLGDPGDKPDFGFTLGTLLGREVAFLADRGKTRVPVIAGAGALSPIVVGGVVGEGAPAGRYSIYLTQRQPDGQISGAAEMEVNIG